ncbi:DUF2254 domain-containing protein [Microbulbifer thermotolerans]|uniref:DUF2254 domain-containing protein n=1 Tax=Microbulbifer thermotolerans TaxID=252514 RepID=UPI0022488F26|nr:DUF2254 domain-containing protein [Microbulbifer thermotolerans]MCX2793804.1 DUF2254 domain-containing protein [Microbulbifer thermotolerans]
MIQSLVHLSEKLRSSFWSLPLLMILSAMAIAHILLQLDDWIDPAGMTGLTWLRLRDPDSARALLSTIASSTITVAGTVFSITVVALTLASNQFGPSLVRNFIRDRRTQASLGIFLATFVYALMIMRSMDTLGEHTSKYDLAVQAALLMALISIGVLIYFIHNVAQSIQVDNITHHINREFHLAIEREYPLSHEYTNGEKFDTGRLDLGSSWVEVPTARGGYVQLVDRQKLIALAQEHDCCLQITCHAGSFLHHWSSIGRIYQAPRDCTTLIAKTQSALRIGPLPTAEQDIVFSVRQLSQIAVRALSPGVNDPYTTYTCIDRLIEGLGTVLQRPQPPNCFCDDKGKLRLITRKLEFSQLLDAALEEICEYSRGNSMVIRQLLKALSQLADVCARDNDTKALCSYLQRLEEDCRIFLKSPSDQAIAEEKIDTIQQKLAKGKAG